MRCLTSLRFRCWRSRSIHFSSRVVWAILITGLICTAAAFTVQAWAQQFIPPTHTALIFALEPVFAWLTSFVVEGERLGLRATLGALLILAGVLVSELFPGVPRRAGGTCGRNVGVVGTEVHIYRNGSD